jgi:hypothetical protein
VRMMQAAALATRGDQAGPGAERADAVGAGCRAVPQRRLPRPGPALLAGVMHTSARTCAPSSFHSTLLDPISAHSRLLPEQQSSASTRMHTRKLRRVSPESRYCIACPTPLRVRSSSSSWRPARQAAGRRAAQRAARLVQEVGEGGVEAVADLTHVHGPLQHDGRQVRARAVRRQDRPARRRSASPPIAGQRDGHDRLRCHPAPPGRTARSRPSQPTSRVLAKPVRHKCAYRTGAPRWAWWRGRPAGRAPHEEQARQVGRVGGRHGRAGAPVERRRQKRKARLVEQAAEQVGAAALRAAAASGRGTCAYSVTSWHAVISTKSAHRFVREAMGKHLDQDLSTPALARQSTSLRSFSPRAAAPPGC